jgi:dipeptidyl aminopeptidase/acylaminoacyl peptidase
MKRMLLIFAAVLFTSAAASARSIGFADLRQTVGLGDPQISPDGTRVVVMRSTQDFGKDRRLTAMMLLDVRTHRMRALTYEREGVSSPAWSADGSRVAFLSSGVRDGKAKGKAQIFVLRMDGGDPKQITDAPQGVDGYAWSPDNSQFAYVTQDTPRKEIGFYVGDNDYLHHETAVPSHLWVVSASGGKARRLTSGAWSLGIVDPYITSSLSWSPDGKQIAYTHFPNAINGDTLTAYDEAVEVRTGRRSALTRNGSLEGDPAFAPAGDLLAYRRNTAGDATNGNAIYVTRAGSRAAGTDVRAAIDRNINAMQWAPDGASLWLVGQSGEDSALWYVSADGKRVQRVRLNGVAMGGVSRPARSGAVVFIGSTARHPGELYYLASPQSTPQRLTDENAHFDSLQLGRVEPLRWHNGRFAEDGVVTLPPHYDARRSYPLVLLVHGGPQSASTIGWNQQNQVFAAHGYVIFNPNYRGSTNLGDAYEHAIWHDAGQGPGTDVMAGIAALERRYNIDRSRVAVTGWSYGGYMTSWMESHYHIWKAAVAGAALNDWFDDYNVAFYVHTDEPWFGGSPWNPKFSAMWRDQSPITYAQQIKTPTLIMGDIGDNNVTITNSFKMFHALRDNGVPVQFVAYPVHGHFPTDPAQSEDVQKRWLAWIDRYFKGTSS